MEKARKWKRVIAILLTVTMIFQNGASVTASGDLHMVPETNVESEAAAQAAAESEAKAKAESEAAAQAAAESEAQAKAESEAAAKAAAESEAQAKAESEAAAKAESEAAAQAAAESEAQAKAESEAAAKAAAESEAKAKAESESQAAAESEAAKAESESQAKETETTKPEESETAAPTEKETEAPTEKETEKESETPAPAESEATKPAESETAPVTYKVTFEQNAALHGTISVDNAAVDVSAYYKEVEQNQAFRFTVTASEGYEVEFVRLDNVDLPKTENPNEYQIPNVTKDSQVVVSYKEVPQSEAEGSDTSEETAESESEPAESETAVQNLVTFTGENVTITANGTAVTDGTAMALDGKIVFTIVPAEGFAVTEVLVDGSIPARTTGNPNEYIIEGIQTDETVVSIATETVETEVAETESEVVESESEVPETESETEIQTEATMPAQTLNANVGNVQVTVNAVEGVLPEGTIVKATMVSSDMVRDAVEAQAATEGKEVVDLIAVDVTLYDSEGNEIQPQGEVNVSFNNVSVGDETSDSAAVYHVDDQGLEAEKIAETSVENGTVGFQAEHFSIYTLAALSNSDANEIEVLNDENQEFYTLRVFQIVKKLVGDEMQEESQTALPSQQFEANTPYTVDVPNMVGYTVAAYAEDRVTPIDIQDNGTITGTITKDTIIYIEYTPESNVEYIVKHCLQNLNRDGYDDPQEGDSYNGISLYEKKTGTTGSDTEAQPLSIPGFEAQEFVNVEISGDGTTVVEINYDRSRVSLSYDTDGGSYVERQFAFTGQSVTVASRPLKDGYEFAGWYSEDGKEVKEGSEYKLDTSETLEAHWTAQEVDYKVVYFKQQIDGTYVGGGEATPGRFSEKPNAGDPVVENGQLTIDDRLLNNNKFEYYYLNKEKTIAENQDVTYAGNGETIVKVYYDLIVYTLKFTLPGNNRQHGDYTFSASLDGKKDPLGNSVVISSDRKTYSFKARLGDNILDIFPTYQYVDGVCNDCSNMWGQATFGSWSPNIRSSRPKLDVELIDNGNGSKYSTTGSSNMSFTRESKEGWGCIRNANTINTYWLQTIEAAENDLYDKNDTNYHRDFSLDTAYTGDLTQKEIFGFTKYEKNGSKHYYFRDEYKLKLNVGSSEIGYSEYKTINNVPYEKHLQEYLTQFTEADRPQNIPEYYEFAGWYPNPEGTGNPVDVQTVTMPGFAKDDDQKQYILYGVWKPKQVTVTYIDAETKDIITKKDITAGETVEELTPEEKDGYIFDGWYTEAENGEYFRFDQPITKDTEIYAVWKPSKVVKYTIYYLEEGTNKELAEEETKKGISGTQVTVYPKTISGYVANDTSGQTITLKQSGNIVKFYYHPPRYYDYYLQYYYKDINGTEHNFGDKIKVSNESVLEGSSVIVRASGIPSGWILSEDETPSKRITVTSEEEKNVARFEIIRDFDFTVTGFDGVYDGLSHGVTVIPGYTQGDNEEFITQYGLSEQGNDWTLEEAQYKYTDASKHTVYVKITHSLTGRSVVKGAEINIDKRPVTFTGNSNTEPIVYDGTEHKVEGFTTNDGTDTGLVEGHTSNVVAEAKGTTQGTHKGTITEKEEVVIKDKEGEDVTRNYTVTTVPGTLTISAIAEAITITADSNNKVYDGTPLTDDGFSYTPGVLLEGDKLTAVVEGSATNVDDAGVNRVVSYKVMRGEVDVTSSYTFNKPVDGTLTITPRPVTFTGNSNAEPIVYDGTEHKVEGFTTNDGTDTGLVEGHTSNVVAEAKGMTQGTHKGTITEKEEVVIKDKEGEDVTRNYTVTTVPGTLTISAIAEAITITADSNNKVYDGTPLTDDGFSYTPGVLLEGDKLTAVVEGSATNVDDAGVNRVVSYKVMRGEVDVTSSYTFNKPVDGTLTITPRPVTFTGNSNAEPIVYDGTEHKVEGFTTNDGTDTGLVEGHTSNVVAEAKGTTQGTHKGTITEKEEVVIKDKEGEDVTRNYTVTTVPGTLTISAIAEAITITADSNNKVYDGTPLTDDGFSYTPGVLLEGDKLTAVVEGSATNVDDAGVNRVVSYKVMRGEVDVTSSYTFNKPVDGTLTITPRPVTFTGNSNAEPIVYDGTEHKVEGFTTNDGTDTGLVEGHTSNVVAEAKGATQGTHKGTITEKEEVVIKDKEGEDVTRNYTVTTVPGTLTISAIAEAITITADSNNKVYDGTPLTDDGFSYTPGVLLEGDKLTAVVEGSATNVDDAGVNRVVSYKVMRGEVDVTSSYTFNKPVDGTLTITPRPVTFTGNSNAEPIVYDGTEHKVEGFTTNDGTDTGLVEGHTSNVVAEAKGATQGTHKGTITEKEEVVIKDKEGEDVTRNYTVTTVPGTLTISAIAEAITITADSNNKVYDGTPLTDDGFSYTPGVLLEGDKLTAVVEGSATNVDDAGVNRVVSYKVMRGEVDVTSSYTFNKPVDGTLTITPRPVTFTGNSNAEPIVYDGTEHKVEGFTTNDGTDTGLVEGHTSNVVAEAKGATQGTHKGTITEKEEVVIKDKEGEDVTRNYTVTTVPGTLTISAIAEAITITADSNNKVYDGTPLTDDGFSYTPGVLLEGDKVTAVVEGSATNVDDAGVNRVVSYKVMRGEVDVTSSYTFNKPVDGTLTITPRPVTFTGNSNAEPIVYDGTEHKVEGFTTNDGTDTGLVEGHTSNVVAEAKGTTQGTHKGTITEKEEVVIKDKEGEDVTRNYTVTTVPGTLTISAIAEAITITADSNNKVYDGTPLTDDGFSYTPGVLLEGDKLTAVVEGSATNVDDAGVNRVVSYKVMRGEVDVTSSYTFNKPVDGTLTITPRPVTFTGNSNAEPIVYDGTEHKVEGFTMNDGTDTGLVEGHTSNVVAEAKGATQGTHKGTITEKEEVVIKDKEGEDVTRNYTVTTVPGTLTISAIAEAITITADSNNKVYDGTPLTDDGFSYTPGVLLEGDKLTAVVEGSATNVDDAGVNRVVSYKVMRGEVDVTSSYTFNKPVDGTLTITPRPVTFTGNSNAEPIVYDGTEHKVEGFTTNDGTDTGLVEGHTSNVVAEAKGATQGTHKGTITEKEEVVIKDKEGEDVTRNYTVTTVPGTLTISAIAEAITITADSNNKVYDGTPLTDDGFSYTPGVLLEGDKLTAVVEGSATNVDDAGVNRVVSYKVMRGEVDVTSSYTFNKPVDGTLTITPRPVTFTGNSNAEPIVYDGTEHKVEGFTTNDGTDTGLVEGHTSNVVAEAKGATQGTHKGTITEKEEVVIKDKEGEDVTRNYTVTTVPGTLTISAIAEAITITADSNNKVYDGTPLTDDGFSYTPGVLLEGDKLTAVVEGSATNVDDAGVNRVVSYKVMRGEVDVTSSYTFNKPVDGTLTITPRPVTFTGNSNAEPIVYDGTEHKVEGFTTNDGTDTGLVEGHTSNVVAEAKGATQGTHKGTITEKEEVVIKDKEGEDVTRNYTVTTVPGTLTISAIAEAITITADSNNKVYDGTPLTDDGFSYTPGVLLEGDKLTAVVEGSATNVDDAGVNRVVSYKVMRGEVDVTSSYTFNKPVDGTLTITPRPVTFTGNSNAEPIVYDGTEHKVEGFTTNDGTDTGLVEGHTSNVVAEAKGMTQGTHKGTITEKEEVVIKDKEGEDVTRNYTVTTVPGTLTISAIAEAITITADSNNKVYDGTPLTDDGFSYTPGVLLEGDKLTAVVEGSATNVDDAGVNRVVSYKVMRGEVDVTSSYTFNKPVDGTLTITPRPVTITGEGWIEDQLYTGADYRSTDFKVEEQNSENTRGLVNGQKLTGLSYLITGTNVGYYEGMFNGTAVIQSDTQDVTGNYTINMTVGSLTILGEVIYNGNTNTSGQVPVDENQYKLNDTITVLGNTGNLEKEKAIFLGWSLTKYDTITTKEDAKEAEILSAGNKFAMGEKSITLYAVWAIDETGPNGGPDETPDYLQYRLIYDGNGNTSGNVPTDNRLYNKDDEALLLAKGDLAKENATFLGWSLAQNDVITSAEEEAAAGILNGKVTFPEDEDLTVYAVWAQDANGPEEKPDETPDYEEYSVTYDGNGADSGEVTDNALYPLDYEVTVKANAFQKANYAFDGWKYTADGSEGEIWPTEKFTIKADTTLYAHWEEDTKGGEPDPENPTNPDGKPDKYQTIFTYVSAGNGTVDPEGIEVHTTPRNETTGKYADKTPVSPSGSVATANTGYAFDYWTAESTLSSRAVNKDFHADMSVFKSDTYMEDTTFTAYFAEDKKGGGSDPDDPTVPDTPDDIPDKYQIIFHYVSADETTGTVTGTVYELYTFGDRENGFREIGEGISPDPHVTPSHAEGYAFDYWTIEGNEEAKDYTEEMSNLSTKLYTTDTTFVANFAEDNGGGGDDGNDPDGIPDKYQIVFRYVSADTTKGIVMGTTFETHTFTDENGNYLEASTVPTSPNADVTVAALSGNAFDYWNVQGQEAKDFSETMNTLKAATYTADTTFVANFDTDNKGGGDDANTPDNIPDKYQVIFRYVSANTAMGTVTGEPDALVEVRTLTTPAGEYLEAAANPVSPRGAVTVNPAAGHSFVSWSDGTTTDYSQTLATIKTMAYSTDTTFTANFSTNGTITVTKLLTMMDGMDEIPMASTESLTYHFGLFTDAAGTTLLGEEYVETVTMQNTSSAQLVFENVPDGTYYVFETDANGNVLPYDTAQGSGTDSYVPVLNGPTNAVTINLAAGENSGQITVTNRYYMDPGGQYYIDAELNITKNVLDGKKEINPDQTFYAGVFTMNEDGSYQLLDGQVIALTSNGTVTTNVPLGGEYGTDEITYYVFETDAQGNILASGDKAFGYDITGGGAVTLSQENFRETVEITNTVMDDGDEPITEEPKTEEPTEEPDTKQTEKPTEKVTDTVKTNTVKTGDDTDVMMYLLILVIAGYVLVVTKKRRREN